MSTKKFFERWFVHCFHNKNAFLVERNADSRKKLPCRKSSSSRLVNVDGAVEPVGVAVVKGKGVPTVNRQNFAKGSITAGKLYSSSVHPPRVTKEKFFIDQQKSVQNMEKKHKVQEIKRKENEGTPAGRGKPSADYLKYQNTKLRAAEPVKRVGVLSSKECERKLEGKQAKPMKRARGRTLKKCKTRKVEPWYPVLDAIPELRSFK